MFKDVLRDVVHQTDGGIAALLMGYDGIAVDKYVREDSSLDVDTIGMEYSVILSQIRKAAEMLEAGNAREVAIQAEKLTTIIRLLNDEYFVAVAIKPDGNFGKARFLLRTSATRLLGELV